MPAKTMEEFNALPEDHKREEITQGLLAAAMAEELKGMKATSPEDVKLHADNREVCLQAAKAFQPKIPVI